MSKLRRIVLVRHGETEGESSIRFHGRTDVALSEEGREQARAVAASLGPQGFDGVVASPMRRAVEFARILAPSAPIQLVREFREIDFGLFEGLTREEIQARHAAAFAEWQAQGPAYDFPEGERRADFRARVERGLEVVKTSGARTVLAVVHKGVVRTLVEALGGGSLEADQPPLAGVVAVTRAGDGSWFRGTRGSDPPGLED